MKTLIILFVLPLFCTESIDGMCPFTNLGRLDIEVLRTWVTLEYTFLRGPQREQAIMDGSFVPENGIPLSIDVVNGDIFVTVPRMGPGIPSTVNRVVTIGREPFLEPFPSLRDQTVGDCNALQSVREFAVDKMAGNIWAVDTGTVNGVPVCPAKLVIINIPARRIIRTHIFPTSIVNQRTGILDDIALDRAGGPVARFAYIGDVVDAKLIVYDFVRDESWSFQDPSMQFDTCATRIVFGNTVFRSRGGIDNLQVTSDSRFLYYGPIASFAVFQVPTVILRNPDSTFSNFVREIGELPLQIFGFEFGTNCSYYSEITRNAIGAWDRTEDINLSMGEGNVRIRTLQNLIRDERLLESVDDLALQDGFLYFVNVRRERDFTGRTGPNILIGRVFVNDF